mgnify:CR=1 FL=1
MSIIEEKIPAHIAVIPDGNRRWAKIKNKRPWSGHLEGAKRSEELAEVVLERGIKCFSLWGGSQSNLAKRPKREVDFLCKIYEQYFKKIAKNKKVHDREVKVNVIGKWREVLPKKTIKEAEKLIDMTKNYSSGKFLNIFVAYNGTEEMMEAIKSIVNEKVKNKSIEINEDVLNDHLWTGDLPPVDLLIRTGSFEDPHNSAGFMMWKCANSQLYFPKKFYPEFGKVEFEEAIEEYQRRERRLGK